MNRLCLSKIRIKIKSLAEEARIIRKEERGFCGDERRHLQDHRRGIVRTESRAANLAYALLRGMPYEVVENNVPLRECDRWTKGTLIKRVHGIIGGSCGQYVNEGGSMSVLRVTKEEIEQWLSGAWRYGTQQDFNPGEVGSIPAVPS